MKKRLNEAWVTTMSPLKYGTDTNNITSFPATVISDGTNASVDIIGNMAQSGTPSPTTPIQPSECGDRTGNLAETVQGGIDATNGMDSRYSDTISQIRTQYIPCDENADYNLTANIFSAQCFIAYYDENQDYISRTTASELNSNRGFTTPVNCAYLRATLYHASDSEQKYPYTDGVKIMISKGSTALPYEPYGVKIPISSANTTTPVYLGEVQSTRKIKKLVLTGEEETWSQHATLTSWFMLNINTLETNTIISNVEICSHYKPSTGTPASIANGEILVNYQDGNKRIIIRDTSYSLLDDFKTYLQQQYSAGTPVTVWYVLATPTTGIVNEPIRKIGEYADTVSGISIPTIAGSQTFNVDTTLKPSEVDLTYHGWHRTEPKERINSDWE